MKERLSHGLAAIALTFLVVGSSVSGTEGIRGMADDNDWIAAGCFIATPKGVVLTIRRDSEAIQLPIGTRQTSESAQATAARETWEETGLDVRVGDLVETFSNETVLLFSCAPVSVIEDYARLKPIDQSEVRNVIVVEPSTMKNHDGRVIALPWRYSSDREVLRLLYEAWKKLPTDPMLIQP